MSHLTDTILHLHGWVALVVIFAVPALESSAFLGFLFPGEVAVLLGGVLAYQHKVSLAGALVAAVAGAIIGDTVGFAVGERWGRRLLHGTVGRIVKHEHLERAERYLAERGGKAVFFGRFTAALRVLIPGMAGMAGMPYRTFALYNIAGGTLWAGGFVILGYIAGNGYKRFEHVAKKASLLLFIAAVVLGLTVFAARKVIAHREGVEAFGRRQLERPRVAALRNRFRRQLDFLFRRLRPGGALGLTLTAALIALVAAAWAFGIVVRNVLAKGKPIGTDQPILDFFVRHRTGPLTDALKITGLLGGAVVIVPLVAIIGALFWWKRHTFGPLLLLGGAYGGSAVLHRVVGPLVARPRPPAALAVSHFTGWSFPSGQAAQATAFWGALALVASAVTSSWSRRVIAWTAAILIAALAGGTGAYSGAHWASDVLGGWAAGALWLFVIAVLSAFTTHLRERTAGGNASGTPPLG